MSSAPSKKSDLKFNTASLLKVAKANGMSVTQLQEALTQMSGLEGFNNIAVSSAKSIQEAIDKYNTNASDAGYKGKNAFQALAKNNRGIVSVDQLKGIDEKELIKKENKDLDLENIQFASEARDTARISAEVKRDLALGAKAAEEEYENLLEAANEFVSNNKGFKKEKSREELITKVYDREDSIRSINIRTAGRILGVSDKEISKTLVADVSNRRMDTKLGKMTAEFLDASTKAQRKKLAKKLNMSEEDVEKRYNALKAEMINDHDDDERKEDAKERNRKHNMSKFKNTFTKNDELKAYTDSYNTQLEELLEDNGVSADAIKVLTDRTGVYSEEEKARVLKEQELDEDTLKEVKILDKKAQESFDAEYELSKKQGSTSKNSAKESKKNEQTKESKQENATTPEEKAQTFGKENMANAPAINNNSQEKESNTKQTITVNLILGKEEIAKITRAIEGEKSGTGGA
jgi:hypothetical protein